MITADKKKGDRRMSEKTKKTLLTITKLVAYFIGWVLLVSIIPIPNSENPAVWRLWAELIPFLCIAGISLMFWYIEKKKIQVLTIYKPVRSCVIGTGFGVLWIGLTFLSMILLGVLRIESINAVSMLGLWIFSAFVNTIMQEILVRGYLYQVIKAKHNIVVATVVSSTLFTLMHGSAFEAGIVPVFNVLSMSLLMTIVLEYTKSLIAPIIMHFLWNSIGAIILGGVSLADDYPHLLTAIFSGNELLSGGIYKMEGSLIVSVINVVLVSCFYFLERRKGQILVSDSTEK